MKKFRWTMILSIIMLLISCGNGGEKPAAGGEAPAGGEAKKEIKIGVALYKFDDTFISSVKDAINEISDEKSKETGEKITINAVDGQGQQATQNDQVDTFITQGYDVIAVNMVDRTAASVIIQKAQAAGIPVVFFNREPVAEDMAKWDQLYYVGAKAEESGTIQGEVAAAYFKANNITKLPSPKKLEAEYAQLASEKAKFYEQYKEAKEELLKLKTAKQNVASFFREEEPAQQER